jgi:8-hydroxy-5-deazaflavin:NADPH oxidoreductase
VVGDLPDMPFADMIEHAERMTLERFGPLVVRLFAADGEALAGVIEAPTRCARAAAATLDFGVEGLADADAAAGADIVVVTVPFAAREGTLAGIAPHVAGKIVIDTSVPLVPPTVMRVQLPEGSAVQRARALVGRDATMVPAFHNVAAHKLATDVMVECDVLVFSDY